MAAFLHFPFFWAPHFFGFGLLTYFLPNLEPGRRAAARA